jgi:hypothetical protein
MAVGTPAGQAYQHKWRAMTGGIAPPAQATRLSDPANDKFQRDEGNGQQLG